MIISSENLQGGFDMPSRIIKESIWTSPDMRKLTAFGERHFYRCLMTTDDFGCFEATPLVIRGRCYPLYPEIKEKDISQWNNELEKAGIARFWAEAERIYGIFLSFSKHQRIRSTHLRKTPPPPADLCQPLTTDDSECPPIFNSILNYNSITTLSGKKEARPHEDIPYQEIIEDLNSLSGRKFQHDIASTRALIDARFREGRTLDDFRRVHRNKLDWVGDPKQSKFYRPETLYSAKHFESYLNESPPVESNAGKDAYREVAQRDAAERHRKWLEMKERDGKVDIGKLREEGKNAAGQKSTGSEAAGNNAGVPGQRPDGAVREPGTGDGGSDKAEGVQHEHSTVVR